MNRILTAEQLAKGFWLRIGSLSAGDDGYVLWLPYRVLSRERGTIVVEEPTITEDEPGYLVLNGSRRIACP